MDALALLCNLHANGPSTVRRLHRAGIRHLEQLGELPLDALAEHLNGPPSMARRFVIEARTLQRRMGSAPLESEGVAQLDGEEPCGDFILPPPERLERPERPARPERRASAPARASQARVTAEALLQPRLVPGLDAALCERLVGQGVRTAGALVEMTHLHLARRVGITFTQLLELQYQARALLQGATPAAATGRPSEQSWAFPEVQLEPAPVRSARPGLASLAPPASESGVAGPFV